MKFWNWLKNLFKPSMYRKLSAREIRQLDRAVAHRPTVEEYLNSCCDNESRNMNGGCDNCGDPCI